MIYYIVSQMYINRQHSDYVAVTNTEVTPCQSRAGGNLAVLRHKLLLNSRIGG